MREVFRIDVSFPRHILSVHVEKLSQQLDRALRTDVYGFHERNHKCHQKLPWSKWIRVGGLKRNGNMILCAGTHLYVGVWPNEKLAP